MPQEKPSEGQEEAAATGRDADGGGETRAEDRRGEGEPERHPVTPGGPEVGGKSDETIVPAVPAPASKRRAASPGLRAAVLVGAAAVLLVALVAGLIATSANLRHHQAADRARGQALSAARTYAVDLASYDYHNLDRDFGVVLANSTPAFAKSFTQSSSALKAVLGKYRATAKAQVVASGVESSSTSHAVVLVFLNQTVTNTTQKKGPTTDQSRLEMSLVHSGGHWAIDAVHLL